jgi:presenilin-like A22 family membrane protease
MNTENLKLSFLIQIIIVFLVMSFLSLATANSMITGKVVYTSEPVQSVYVPPAPAPPYHPVQVDIFQFLVSFFLATVLLLVFLELFKGKFLFEVFFSGAVIFGAQGPLGIVFAKFGALAASVAIVVLRFLFPRIWTQNVAIILGIAGISASLGLSVNPLMALIILVLLSVYDIIAVYKTRHMVKLFKGMAKRGAVLALVIPKNFSLWLSKFEAVSLKNKDEYIFLGTGDLALPLFFAISALPLGINFSLAIISGAIIGFVANHFIFIKQREKKAIPALPAIAFFSIMGYVFITYNL